jgi:hypothetical protein
MDAYFRGPTSPSVPLPVAPRRRSLRPGPFRLAPCARRVLARLRGPGAVARVAWTGRGSRGTVREPPWGRFWGEGPVHGAGAGRL